MNDSVTVVPSPIMEHLFASGQKPVGLVTQLKGGAISSTFRFSSNTGGRYVAKYLTDGPADLFEKEAQGLTALNQPDFPRVPNVIAVAQHFLLLEDLGSGTHKPDYWDTFGRQVAALHAHVGPQFGYEFDNYLGLAPQLNTPTDDGYEFFAQQRVLRYIDHGKCRQLLTRGDRKAIHTFCNRLPALVPAQPPSFCHGDLWHGNIVVTEEGDPAYVDPAVFFGWAEADLGMTTQYGSLDTRFYDAYDEAGSLTPGWRDRLDIYHIKEWLSMVAHFGEKHNALKRLRELLKKYT